MRVVLVTQQASSSGSAPRQPSKDIMENDPESARRFTSAKCSQVLTMLRGRSHDNFPVGVLVVLHVDAVGTSGEMHANDDMQGS